MSTLTFPEGFLWGASTSAYQTEGTDAATDWLRWDEDERVPPRGRACDSWSRWRDDLDVAAELGLGIYRISLEWAALEPAPGAWDDAAFDHYAEVLAAARARGMKTMVVLWHFTNPAWLAERGGWLSPDAPDRFAVYAQAAARRLGRLVDYWATLNEADTYVAQGFVRGVWPPGRTGALRDGWRAYRALAEAHRLAYPLIKEASPKGARVGLTHAFTWARPTGGGGVLRAVPVACWNFIANDAFIRETRGCLDWLGVQYYLAMPIRLTGLALGEGSHPVTDVGWRIEPRGLYEALMRAWRRCRVPLIVTENGLADAADRQRGRFILDHLAWVRRSIAKGADVRGYLHWSLLDNYEWALGYGPRFGLAETDYSTLERRIRPSGRLYAEIARSNALPDGLCPELTYADGSGSLAPSR